MFELKWQLNLIVQGLILVIIIGVFYSLLMTTRAYGGLIGSAIRLLGVGIILISVSVIEKMLANFEVIENSVQLDLGQDILTLIGLMFLAYGFKRLANIAKP